MFEAVIIGGGPAALGAAETLLKQAIPFAWMTGTRRSVFLEEQASVDIFPSWEDLMNRAEKLLRKSKAQFLLKEGGRVTDIQRSGGVFRLRLESGELIDAQTVVLASGVKARRLSVEGEEMFLGKGIRYGIPLERLSFQDKQVAVVGGGMMAIESAFTIAPLAASLNLLVAQPRLSGNALQKRRLLETPRLTLTTGVSIIAFEGKKHLSTVRFVGPDQRERTLKVDEVVLATGTEPGAEYVSFLAKDRFGRVIVDKYQSTNVEGIWAAGMVTDRGINDPHCAFGEGVRAALEVTRYLR